MNILLLVASCLLVALAVAHSWLGERYLLIRLFRRSGLPHLFGSDLFTKRTLRFAWHLTSIAWLGLAGVLVVVARPGAVAPLHGILLVLVATFVASGLLALVVSRGRHLSWLVFLITAFITWWAGR